MVTHNNLYLQFRGIQCPLWPLQSLHLCGAKHACKEDAPTHKFTLKGKVQVNIVRCPDEEMLHSFGGGGGVTIRALCMLSDRSVTEPHPGPKVHTASNPLKAFCS